MKDIITLIRPKQWIKNIFVIFPIFFGHNIYDLKTWGNIAILFLAFSLAASTVYVFNDLCDKEIDRLHPEKKNRPIACGSISNNQAQLIIVSLMILSGSLLFALGLPKGLYAGYCIICYLIINIIYSLWGKHQPVLDAFFVASGFLLRVISGCLVASIVASHWLFLMVFFVSLLLAFGKRLEDLLIAEDKKDEQSTRPVIKFYSSQFLFATLTLISAILLVLYTLYCIDSESIELHGKYLYTTIPIVSLGIIYYLRRVIVDRKYCNPTDLIFKDHGLQAIIICWIIQFYTISYVIA